MQRCQSGLSLKIFRFPGNPKQCASNYHLTHSTTQQLFFATYVALQRCQSGRMCRSRKPIYLKRYRGFKSLSLRQKKKLHYKLSFSACVKTVELTFVFSFSDQTKNALTLAFLSLLKWLKQKWLNLPLANFLNASRLSLRPKVSRLERLVFLHNF